MRGAEAASLAPEYVEKLRNMPVRPRPDYGPFQPPPGSIEILTRDELAERPMLTGLAGHLFDMSEARPELRDHFEVDARHIALAALQGLALDGAIEPAGVREAVERFGIDADKHDPAAC